MTMRILDLCSGSGSATKAFKDRGHDVYSVDIEAKFNPDLVFDVSKLSPDFLRGFDFVWASPPCQDISVAGKGAGIKEGTRSGLWLEFKRIIGEIQPRYVLVENVSALVRRGIDTVLAGLHEIGYDAVWFNLQAREVGALHRRERIFIVGWRRELADTDIIGRFSGGRAEREHEDILPQVRASEENKQQGSGWEHRSGEDGEALSDSTGGRRQERQPEGQQEDDTGEEGERAGEEQMANSDVERLEGSRSAREQEPRIQVEERVSRRDGSRIWKGYWSAEPDVDRVADGVAFRVDRLKLLGNGVVPQVAREVGKVILWLEGME